MVPTQPNFLDMPFAQNGGRNTIPASGEEDEGNATLDQGFPIITEQPLSQGGLPPRRKDFNGILYALSNFCFFAQSGGVFTYDTTLNYRSPALVWYNNYLYLCVKSNGPDSTVVVPGTNDSYWKDFVDFLGVYTKDEIDTLISPSNITASKLGTATVGGTARGIYLNAGSPQAMSATVGSSSKPVWLNNGTITECTSSIGGDSYVTSSWHSGENWYRKWSDGFIEQGGRGTIAKGGGWISLPTAMTTTTYTLMMTKNYPSNGRQSGVVYFGTRETSRFWAMAAHQGGSGTWDSYDCNFHVTGW